MKYLLFEDPAGNKAPILFPDRVSHEEMRDQMPYATVLSGGSVLHDGQRFICKGQALDLGVSAREGDAEIIARHFKPNE